MNATRLFTTMLVSGLLAAFGASAIAADATSKPGDWPQWRGPNRDDLSKETGLLTKWPAKGPALAWKIKGVGIGYSGVAVSRGTIFTMGDIGNESHLIALAEADGTQLWSRKIGAAGAYGGFIGTRGTPTVDGDLVYALNQHGDLICVEAATGKTVWNKSLTADFGGSTPQWGYAESPLVEGDLVICTPGGRKGAIVALNKKTGATAWQSKEFTDNAHYSSLIIENLFGVRQVIQLTAASVAGVAAIDGKLMWRAARTGKTAVVPTPVFADNQVFVTSGYGIGCNAFKISKGVDGYKTDQVYANTNMVNHHGGVILLDGFLYELVQK